MPFVIFTFNVSRDVIVLQLTDLSGSPLEWLAVRYYSDQL